MADEVFEDLLPPEVLNAPKGRATPEQASQAVGGMDMRRPISRVVNAASGGYSGAQMGSLLGTPGAIAGGVAGAGLGAFLESDTPFTDAGALLGDFALSKVVPPGTSRLGRFLAGSAGTAIGSILGSVGDKQANFINETPWGKIAVYTGMTAGSLGMEAALRSLRPTAAFQSAQELQTVLGEKMPYPLNFSEATGSGKKFVQDMTIGTRAGTRLAKEQAAYAKRAFEKIMNKQITAAPDIVEGGLSSQTAAKKLIKEDRFQNIIKTKDPVTGKVTTTKEMSWKKFAAAFGLDKNEVAYFRDAISKSPETFIDSFLNSSKTHMNGLYALRALNKSLPPEEFAPLGNALVMRILDKNRAFNATDDAGNLILSGKAFHDALFNKFGAERLAYALGPDKAEALYKLGVVMEEADPLKKLRDAPVTWKDRIISYVANKGLFFATGAAVGATQGSEMGGTTAAAVAGGMIGGMTVAAGASAVISRILTNPVLADFLLKASRHGDLTAANAFIRALGSNTVKEERPASTPATRLDLDPFLAGR